MAAEEGLSFASDLLVGFDRVTKFTDEGVRHLKDTIGLFKKRQVLELEYAKGLAKLAGQFKTSVPGSKQTSLHGPKGPNDGRSLWVAYYNILEEIQLKALEHEQIGIGLGLQVTEPLAAILKGVEAERRVLISDGQRYNKQLQEAYTALKKAQASNQQSQKEADELAAAAEKARHNFLTKETTQAKVDSKWKTAADKASQMATQLEETQGFCERTQSQHFNVNMPNVLTALEKLEADRCEQVKDALLLAEDLEVQSFTRQLTKKQDMVTLLQDVDVRDDIEEFICQHQTGDTADIPITSIIAPTMKGHLDRQILGSNRPWKDHVFVLVGRQRRLYEYESEDSQHPKYVLTLPLSERAVRPVDDSLFNRTNAFQIITKERVIFLAAPDKVAFNKWQARLAEVCLSKRASRMDLFKIIRSISVKVTEAKDLPKSGDYFCLVLLDSERQARTLTKPNTNSPYWGQTFHLDNLPSAVKCINIEVYRVNTNLIKQATNIKRKMVSVVSNTTPRKDSSAPKVTPDDLIGVVPIELANVQQKEGWYNIISTSIDQAEAGSVRLKVTYTDEYVRPLHEYQPLREMFSSAEAPGVFRLLDQTVAPADRIPLVSSLINVTAAEDKLMAFLLTICISEIEATADENTLFRGNSLASKAVDQFMKLKCIEEGKFLTHALGVVVQTLYDLKQPCEVDPTRLDSSDTQKEVSTNMKRLLHHTNLVWNSVLHSLDALPVELQFLFKGIKEAVSKRFSSAQAQQSAIAGFFFLRLICPAILGPQLFGLQQHMPTDHTARTCTLISKTLQNLANGVQFGGKEPYMLPMNEFLMAHESSMRDCLQTLCDCKDAVVAGSVLSSDEPRSLASLQRILHANIESIRDGSDLGTRLADAVFELKRPEKLPEVERKVSAEQLASPVPTVTSQPSSGKKKSMSLFRRAKHNKQHSLDVKSDQSRRVSGQGLAAPATNSSPSSLFSSPAGSPVPSPTIPRSAENSPLPLTSVGAADLELATPPPKPASHQKPARRVSMAVSSSDGERKPVARQSAVSQLQEEEGSPNPRGSDAVFLELGLIGSEEADGGLNGEVEA